MISFGSFTFKSYSEAREFAKQILNNNNIGKTVSDQEKAFFIDALKLRGQRGTDKIGVGILDISIGKNDFNGRCFIIERKDGSKTDFSYIKCFAGHSSRSKKPEKLKDVEAACRTAILKDKPMKDKGYRVHHDQIQFKDLVSGFLRDYNLDYENIEILGYEDGETQKSFKNPKIARLFQIYHKKIATMKILSVDAHKKEHNPKRSRII